MQTKQPQLAELLRKLKLPADFDKQQLCSDSRCIKPGMTFIALGDNARAYVNAKQAIANGASIIVHDSSLKIKSDKTKCYAIKALRKTLPDLAAAFYGNPSYKLNTVAVTGTNGKSSICYGLASLYAALEQNWAICGTLGWGNINSLQQSKLTTPDNLSLQHYLAQIVAEGNLGVCLEASSHALMQNRLQNIAIDSAIYTRLSRDHLDYHLTMDNYAAAKAKLAARDELKNLIINADCNWSEKWQSQAETWAYSLHKAHDTHPTFYLSNIKPHDTGFEVLLHCPFATCKLNVPLLGMFNLENTLAIIASAAINGQDIQKISLAVEKLKPAPGRLERFDHPSGAKVFIDYAHTPDALAQALAALRLHHSGNLSCIFGCGGDRDQGKRALMGQACAQHADKIIICNDNPRSERPEDIAHAILAGITDAKNATITYDRAQAIAQTLENAVADDIILIAGKGHEQTQTIGTETLDFSDREYTKKLLNLC